MIALTAWQLVGVVLAAALVGVGLDRALCGVLALLDSLWSGTETRLRAFRAYSQERDAHRATKRERDDTIDQLRAEVRTLTAQLADRRPEALDVQIVGEFITGAQRLSRDLARKKPS